VNPRPLRSPVALKQWGLAGLEYADPQVSSDMGRTIDEILGAGQWMTIKKPWESHQLDP